MPDEGLESIVKTNTEEKVRNDVFIRFTEDDLFSSRGPKHLRSALSSRIAEPVSGFGIAINPQFGVAVMNMQPNEIYQRAMQEEAAATSQGNAVPKRVAPTLQNQDLQQALQVLYTHFASMITKTNNVPGQIYNIQNGHEVRIKDEVVDPMIRNVPEGPPSMPPRKPKTERQYPIAADQRGKPATTTGFKSTSIEACFHFLFRTFALFPCYTRRVDETYYIRRGC